MKVSLAWLKEFFEEGALDSYEPNRIADTLTSLGLVCEDIIDSGYTTRGVVVAEIVNVRAHPSADKIRIADVNAGPEVNGGQETIQICCGAPNLSIGDKVPLATVGTVLPDGLEIQPRKMRGEDSSGMLCAAAEIGLADDGVDGLAVLDSSLTVGTPLEEALQLQSDTVFDLDIEGNRPDALCVLGVARDLAAKLELKLIEPEYKTTGAETNPIVTKLDVPDLCSRFGVRVITNLGAGESPSWMKQRLIAAGMRPISAIVDISNYVMLELGQPNHTYDLDKLDGEGFHVRLAVGGEQLVTLDGAERELTEADLVVCDATSNPVGLAGVMGGASTEISDTTSRIVVEAAVWDRMTVAKTVRRLNLRSEASTRFERGVDPAGVERALNRFCQLAAEICGAELSFAAHVTEGSAVEKTAVKVRTSRVNSFLNASLSAQKIKDYLDPIGFSTAIVSDENLVVDIPSWRPDSSIEEDVIEEVGRHYGYENIGKRVPRSPKSGYLTQSQLARRQLMLSARALGHSEAMPMPFLDPSDVELVTPSVKPIALRNPLVSAESVLRTTLLPGLLKAAAYNQSHRQPAVKLFEAGRVFLPAQDELPDEFERIAFIATGFSADGSAARYAAQVLASVFDANKLGDFQIVNDPQAALHPTRSAQVKYRGKAIGEVGEVSPKVLEAFGVSDRVAWLSLDTAPLYAAMAKPAKLKAVSRFPSTDIDLAFSVPKDVASQKVAAAITSAAGKLLAELDLFDAFYGKEDDSARSLAYRLRLQSDSGTLTEEEIARVRQDCIENVNKLTGSTLRS